MKTKNPSPTYFSDTVSEKLTVGSLFAGIGGLEKGLEDTGHFETKWQVEIDDYATRVLERHWPNVRRWRDVTTFPPDTTGGAGRRAEKRGQEGRELDTGIHGSPWHVDLICGGFPCQDISYGLFYEVARIVRILEPQYVLLENVAALLTRGLDAVLGTLASLGYDAEWHCIPAAAVGAPHIRDRVFILAYTQRDRRNQRRAVREGQFGSAALVCPGDASDAAGEGTREIRDASQAEGPQSGDELLGTSGGIPRDASDTHSPRLEKRQGQDSGGAWPHRWAKPQRSEWWNAQCRLGIHPDGLSSGLDGCGGWECGIPRVTAGQKHRVARLKCLGNAVVPQVAEYIGHRIWEHFSDTVSDF